MSKIRIAEDFAKEKHRNMLQVDGTPYHEHLSGVTSRLKNLGITDEDTLAAGWLHDTIEFTNTNLNEIEERFGSKIAVMVLSLSKDKSLPKMKREEVYVKQLRDSPLEAKIIKICDLSSEIKQLSKSELSRTKIVKELKKRVFYLDVVKVDFYKNGNRFPLVHNLMESINDVIVGYGLRPIILVK